MHVDPETHRLMDGSGVILRTGVETDATQLLSALDRCVRQNDGMLWEPGEHGKTEDDTRTWISGMLSNPCELLLLAEVRGEIVGNIDFHIGGRRRIQHIGELGMAVVPGNRRRGIGGRLLERMIRWARTVPQLERAELRVISNNAAAIGLYRKFGFSEEGRLPRRIKYADGTYADDVLMGFNLKDLAHD